LPLPENEPVFLDRPARSLAIVLTELFRFLYARRAFTIFWKLVWSHYSIFSC